MNALIIGLGSIARKHIAAIKKIDKEVKLFALRSNKSVALESDIKNVFSFDEIDLNLDFCIICNPTSEHYKTILKCLELNIPLFIEKPSLMNLNGANKLIKEINERNIITYVALNLRFHPIIKFLKEYLINKRVIEANVYCGSYLPDWRPNIDYTKNYSAIARMGGGVHLDLIHEIDYSVWLFGLPKETISIKKRISDLDIDSMDMAVYHLLYDNKIVNITLNYYRKQPKREIEIIFDNEIIKVDLLDNYVKNSNEEIIFSSSVDNKYTYEEQMKYFYNLIQSSKKSFSSFQDSIETLKISLK